MLDTELYNELQAKKELRVYKFMLDARKRLPAFKMQQEILHAINHNQIVLLSGETGEFTTAKIIVRRVKSSFVSV